jgi:hypothetical protein
MALHLHEQLTKNHDLLIQAPGGSAIIGEGGYVSPLNELRTHRSRGVRAVEKKRHTICTMRVRTTAQAIR